MKQFLHLAMKQVLQKPLLAVYFAFPPLMFLNLYFMFPREGVMLSEVTESFVNISNMSLLEGNVSVSRGFFYGKESIPLVHLVPMQDAVSEALKASKRLPVRNFREGRSLFSGPSTFHQLLPLLHSHIHIIQPSVEKSEIDSIWQSLHFPIMFGLRGAHLSRHFDTPDSYDCAANPNVIVCQKTQSAPIKPSDAYVGSVSELIFAQFMQPMLVVARNALVISQGTIVVGKRYISLRGLCLSESYPGDIPTGAIPRYEKPVFVVSQVWGGAVFHMLLETMSRLSLYLEQIIAADMLIHVVPSDFVFRMFDFLQG